MGLVCHSTHSRGTTRVNLGVRPFLFVHLMALSMIHRDARTDLACLIRRYLNEELTAYEFDDALDPYYASTDDAVRFVASDLWMFYDDCENHLVRLTKPQWDYHQRLLLLLESDYSVTMTHKRKWAVSQVFAALLLLCCLWLVLRTGLGYHLLIWFVPFGAGSIAIAQSRRPIKVHHPYQPIVTPFHSLHDLWAACDATGFRKCQYPSRVAARNTQSQVKGLTCSSYIGWACVAPIPLLIQCFPTIITTVHVTPA